MTTILYHHFPVQLSEVRRFNFDMGHVIFLPTNEGWGAVPATVAGAGFTGVVLLVFFETLAAAAFASSPFAAARWSVGLAQCYPADRAAWGVWSFCDRKTAAVFGDVLKRWILYGLIGYMGEPLQSVSLESVAVVFLLAGASIFVKILLRYVCETFAKNVLAGLKPMKSKSKPNPYETLLSSTQ